MRHNLPSTETYSQRQSCCEHFFIILILIILILILLTLLIIIITIIIAKPTIIIIIVIMIKLLSENTVTKVMFQCFYVFIAKGTEIVWSNSDFKKKVFGSNSSMEQFKLKSSTLSSFQQNAGGMPMSELSPSSY